MTDDRLDHRLLAPPVFVVGHPRSGTTWVFEALEAHPEAAGVFESWLFHDRLGLAGLYNPAFWDAEISATNLRDVGRPLGTAQLIDRESMTADLRALAWRWLGRALQPGQHYLIEKSPVHLHFAEVIAEIFPEARFVEIVRDGRDAAVSALAASRGWGPGLVRGSSAPSVADIARDWSVTVEEGARQQELLGERWTRVRFEDLKAEFDHTMAGLFRFCGMPCDESVLEQVRTLTDLARQPTGEARFRRAGRVGDWQARFSRGDARAFDREAGETLVSLGYEHDRTWWRERALRTNRVRHVALPAVTVLR